MDNKTKVDRLLFSIFLLREPYEKASKKQTNFEVRNKLAELDKLETYLQSGDLGPRALLEVRNKVLELTEYAKNISKDEGETASAQTYTPMNQTPKADGNDWNRMAQIAKTTSESGNIGPYSQSEDRYGRFHEQEEMPSSYYAQNSSLSRPSYNVGPYSQYEDRYGRFHEQEDIPLSYNARNSSLSRPSYNVGPYSRSEDRYGRFHEQEEMPSSFNAQTSSLSRPSYNIGPYSQSEVHYGRFHEQEEMPSSYNAQTSSLSQPIHKASSRSSRSSNSYHQEVHALMQSPIVQSVLNTGVDRNRVRTVIEKMLRETGNTYPNAEALMNAVLNYEQTRGASSSNHQGPPQNPQTDERRNARRRPRSSGHQEETRQTQAYMQSSMVQRVLNTDVDRDRVKNVIERRLRDRGNTYPNAEALMNAVLNYEHNHGELNTSSSHHHGHPQNPQTDERRNGRRRSRSSTSNEGETAFAQTYTPMNQTLKADGNDWNRMAQVAKTTSESDHQDVHALMQSPIVQSVLNTGVDRNRVRNVIERRLRETGNTYPNAEALMNAVLNYEHNYGELNTSSSHHHGHPQNPQTDERRNGRRRSRSSTSNEGETASTQKYTPMNQTPKADGNDWNRMAQVAKTTSESGIDVSNDTD